MHLPAAYHMLSLGTWRVRMNRSEIKSRRMALWPALLPVTWGWCQTPHCKISSTVLLPPFETVPSSMQAMTVTVFSPRFTQHCGPKRIEARDNVSRTPEGKAYHPHKSGSLSGLLHTEHQTSNIDMPGYLIYATLTNCQNHGFQERSSSP